MVEESLVEQAKTILWCVMMRKCAVLSFWESAVVVVNSL